MDLGLAGKTALVSGGSKGIGLATAKLLAAEGARVAICARNPVTLEAAADMLREIAPGRVLAVSADLTDGGEIKRVVTQVRAELGEIDVAVSNVIGHQVQSDAKGPPPGHFRDVPPAELGAEFRQLVRSSWLLAREVAPAMVKRGWGRIINIGSGVAREPMWELPHFLPNVARPAAAAVHKIMARELSGTGVTVNTILTGAIATERNEAYFKWLASERSMTVDDLHAEFFAGTPLRRPGKPIEMASVIAFLCSQDAAPISGQAIPVTGGMLRNIY
jgi:3-oxoacyl-[acyl-carrier protein] reductase